jgi:hypothetical protein
MSILRNIISKLNQFDKYLDRDFQNDVDDAEIRAFFILRHQNMPYSAWLQQEVIKAWEPRVAKLIEPVHGLRYAKLRDFLGLSTHGIKERYPLIKKNRTTDRLFAAREVLDLRDEVIISGKVY